TIVIQGTTRGTVTNADGEYSISSLPEDAILVFSFVGMRTQEIPIDGRTTFTVVMEEETIGIEEVVAVGYGTQKKINLTGSISSIASEELTEVSMPTLAHVAMGKASGVFIKNVNGQPGDATGIDINIRGFGRPLIIIDGMPSTAWEFQQLDPNDIKEFNILKDAAAAAVYGARAGNGVILVSTKRGETGIGYFGSICASVFGVVSASDSGPNCAII
ncbi:MAG: TonB-dependent receptor plug domain-containing protein, partial [Bacteroidales bacterium]|nr:TonB-dependent receptor plug domain-containing protein [Bacteroidales bacterium]